MSDPPLSNGVIARRSGLSRSRVQQLATQPIKTMPDKDTVFGLARGLRVPPSVIVDRLLETLELPRPYATGGDDRQQSAQAGASDEPYPESLPARPEYRQIWEISGLTPDEREMAIRVVHYGRKPDDETSETADPRRSAG